MFVVSLLAMVKTMAITFGMFFLLLLVFNDQLGPLNGGEEIFLYIFLGLFLYSLALIIYTFAILLPTYFIDRKKMEELDAPALFRRHAPIITLFLLLITLLAGLIAGKEGLAVGLVQANFFNAFVMVYSGLILFEYQVKSAIYKLQSRSPHMNQVS
jgi:H+/Cl- antiporter ClcA